MPRMSPCNELGIDLLPPNIRMILRAKNLDEDGDVGANRVSDRIAAIPQTEEVRRFHPLARRPRRRISSH
jgi:hypothetical protein